jgi:hypothetical protein
MTAGPTASQLAAQFMTDKAVSSGKVSAEEVAGITFKAIADGQFYIYSHPDALAGVRVNLKSVVAGTNPPDPYAATPQIRELLRAKIKGASKPAG